jgi:DNA-binding transcriptional ArsR family regulator
MERRVRERAAVLFSALSHPARLRITELLTAGERTVGEIASSLDLPQSGTSQHLAVLTRAGVLVVEPRGTSRLYRVRGPRIARILALIEEFCAVHSLYGSETEEDDPGDDDPP